jgi:aerobic carbon-monoxide dehydrogenase large subunit
VGAKIGTTKISRGDRMLRTEDLNLVLGRGRFVADIHLDGMLAAAFVRSAHAHALVRGIDVTKASRTPGVHAVFTMQDLRPHLSGDRLVVSLPSTTIKQQLDRPVLAETEVCHVGEPLAVVLAENRYIAEDAVDDVEVDYEVLEPVVNCLSALRPGGVTAHAASTSNVVAEFDHKFGDIEQAFANAQHVFSERIEQTRGGSHSMECRGNVAVYDERSQEITLWSSTQTPHRARALIAELLGCDETAVRVIAPDVGGGFGPKLVFYQEDIVIVLAAMLVRRPVQWIEDRREHFVATTQEREQIWDVSVACDSSGKLRGIRGRMLHDHGAYTARGVNVAFEAAQNMTMAYDIPACDLNVKLLATNLVPVTPVRGAGQPQGTFAIERLLDRIARELKLDRAEVRERNLIQPSQIPYAKPYRTRGGVPVVIDSGDYPLCQRLALEASGWKDFHKRREAALRDGRYIGIGLANFVELTGRGPYEPATVKINTSGTVRVSSSATAMGQGTKSMLAQIVAEQLGGDVTNIVVTTGDTENSRYGFGGFGSRQTVTAGSSAYVAALKVREKVLTIAGQILECDLGDLEIEGRDVYLKGAREIKVTLGEIAKVSLGTTGFYLPRGIRSPGLEVTEQVILNDMTYANGSAVATVEVDIETGEAAVLDFIISHDCGRAINPTLVEGQIMGGFAHGLGNALFERMIFNEAGQPLTTTLADYLLPTLDVVPSVRLIHVESPTPLNPLGVKGVGEAGVLPTAGAIVSAIEDALRPFGIHISHAPVRPQDLLEKIAEARKLRGDVNA